MYNCYNLEEYLDAYYDEFERSVADVIVRLTDGVPTLTQLNDVLELRSMYYCVDNNNSITIYKTNRDYLYILRKCNIDTTNNKCDIYDYLIYTICIDMYKDKEF